MTDTQAVKPVVLVILDGWGIGDDENPNNAIAMANTPNYNRFLEDYSHSQILTSGQAVGLPYGQMGNSEVGHTNIGAGRIVPQLLNLISENLENGQFENHQIVKDAIKYLKDKNKTLHLCGLLSGSEENGKTYGGVHAHIDHIIGIAKIFAKNGVKVNIHGFLDGRDAPQKSALKYIEKLEEELKNYPTAKLATLIGRYYAMDRDNNSERTQLAIDLISNAKGEKTNNFSTAINANYAAGITDEFMKPIVLESYVGVEEGDILFCANFRPDRMKQITSAFNTNGTFERQIAVTDYSDAHKKFMRILYPKVAVKDSLGELVAKAGFKQFRTAETEKFAHVTYFFNGGQDLKFEGEERILIPSPKDVATYDLKPQMSAMQVTDGLVEAIESGKYALIVVNYANPDMVGHTGSLDAAIKAVEVIDECLGRVEKAVKEKGGVMLITADHGNLEEMRDEKGNPHTQHTTNPVPFIVISDKLAGVKLNNGSLSDIAPTILQLLNLKAPSTMTGATLINSSR
ncbi:MAG: 2,3-bisphosphoglycerate-independent phosphoglycerate mutase [Alphaproteobacteria bacterium]|jgi:2,3-bisphosphoglycerate-independent phosphoglycerate mutase